MVPLLLFHPNLTKTRRRKIATPLLHLLKRSTLAQGTIELPTIFMTLKWRSRSLKAVWSR